MLINLSNHPYGLWSEEQKRAAIEYGPCTDLPFPVVPADADSETVARLADEYLERIMELAAPDTGDNELTVHIMGEQTLCFNLISKLLNRGVRCVASCSARDVESLPDGSKRVKFNFTRFRHYI